MGRVVDLEELVSVRNSLRSQGKKVVFTNGCFDVLHRGHVEFLNEAKRCGDVLFVGLNSDDSVRRIKGKNRPIVPQEDRAYILSNLLAVDYVALFEDDTPRAMIESLLPDVLVKGADWSLEEVVGKEIVERAGGEVRTIPLIPNRSSTGIIERIVKDFGSG